MTDRGEPHTVRRARCGVRRGGLLSLTVLLVGSFLTVPAAATAQPMPRVGAMVTAENNSAGCDTGVNAVPVRARQVDLVLDDSGSMFKGDEGSLDRWSAAKYSVEVLAAMLTEGDVLNVFRTSDFADRSTAKPAVRVKGSAPLSDRVGQVHAMQMVGGGTPYEPVRQAISDLSASSSPEKWLVVLSDGEFDNRTSAQVQSDLEHFVKSDRDADSTRRVAFLALGDSAPKLHSNPKVGVYFEHAEDSSKLLGVMTGFSNRIFGRSLLPQSTPGQADIDIAMDEIMVFAQGGDVEIESLSTSGGTIQPNSSVQVSWADNQRAKYGSDRVPAVPNKALKGKLAVFDDIPPGALTVGVTGAKTIDMFYRPHVAFGIELRDAAGAKVEADKIVGGEYTVDYGFMDANCEIVHSDPSESLVSRPRCSTMARSSPNSSRRVIV
ncbi:MAG: hypothetical protein KDB25_00535 [Leucobacter sp.]|nr:hypothetical protein [Leucobacter sp.]